MEFNTVNFTLLILLFAVICIGQLSYFVSLIMLYICFCCYRATPSHTYLQHGNGMDQSQPSAPLCQTHQPRHLEDFVVNSDQQQTEYTGNMNTAQHTQGQVEEDAVWPLPLLGYGSWKPAFVPPTESLLFEEEMEKIHYKLLDIHQHLGQYVGGSSNKPLLSDSLTEKQEATLLSPVREMQQQTNESQMISTPLHHTSVLESDSLLLDVDSPPPVQPSSPVVIDNPPSIMPQSPTHPHSSQPSTQAAAPQPSQLLPSPESFATSQPQSPHGNQADGAPQPRQREQAQAPDPNAAHLTSPSSTILDYLKSAFGDLRVMTETIYSLSREHASRAVLQGDVPQPEQSALGDVSLLAEGPFATYLPQVMAPQRTPAEHVEPFLPLPVQSNLEASYDPSLFSQFIDAPRVVGQPSSHLQWLPNSTYPSWLPQAPPFGTQGPRQPNPPEPSECQQFSVGMQSRESTCKGPKLIIPGFIHKDPREFAQFKIALENLLPADSTELLKYQILVDHLLLEEARLLADSYLHSPTPYTHTMAALKEKYGQPHQLALSEIATVMDAPDVRHGDFALLERFAHQISALVDMLRTLGSDGEAELQCGSHVSRLLSKLPTELKATFRQQMDYRPGDTNTLVELSEFLQHEVLRGLTDLKAVM